MSRFFDGRLLREAQPARALLALSVVAGAAAGVLIVLQARSLARAVDGAFLRGMDGRGVQPFLVALLLFTAGRAAATWIAEMAAARVAQRVKDDLRERLIAHILALGPAFTGGERTGELANTALEGIDSLDAWFSQYLPQLALAAIVPITFLLVVFPLDPLSGLVLLLTAPLIPIFMILIGHATDSLTQRQWGALSRMSAHFLDVLQGLTTLKLFGRSRDQVVIMGQISEQHRHATFQVLRVAFLSALALEIVGSISTAIVAVQIGLRLLAGQLSFEPAIFILILAPEFYLPLRQLGARFHAGISGVAAARRIFDVLETPLPAGRAVTPPVTAVSGSRASSAPDAGSLGAGPTFGWPYAGSAVEGHPPPRISLQDVTVAYPHRSLPALDRLSFDIEPGAHVALVGETGSGKSTVAALLLRFIEPQVGQITVDGAPLQSIPLGAWRGAVAYVPQQPYLFAGSVGANISLGRPGAAMSEIIAAAEAAGAHDFIAALPDGYDTVVGERGARLSGGQAQRIALARAFLVDAPIVVLDEATANLDPESDAAIQAALARLLRGRSALVIAHRLNTVRTADRIIVLQRGRVVEQGAHASLLEQDGAYARLVAAHRAAWDASAPVDEQSQAKHPEQRAIARSRRDEAPANPTQAEHPSTASALRAASAQDATVGSAPPTAAPSRVSVASPATAHTTAPPAGAPPLPPAAAAPAAAPLRWLLAFLRPFSAWIALSVLLGFLTVGSSIGLLATSAWTIAGAALQPSIAELQVAIVGVRFFGIARGIFRYAERLASHQVTLRVLGAIRVWFYATIEPLAPARLAGYRSGDLLARVISDVGILENFYVRVVAPPLVALLTAALTATLLAGVHPSVVAPVLALQALLGIAVPLAAAALGRTPGRDLTTARARLGEAVVEGVQGAADVLAYRAEARTAGLIRTHGRQVTRAQARLAALSATSNAAGTLITWAAVAAVLTVAVPLVRAGHLPGMMLAVLALLTAASFEAVLPLGAAAQTVETSLAAARRLAQVAGQAPTATEVKGARQAISAPLPAPASASPAQPPPAIRFSEVVLRYDAAQPPALDRVTLHVPPGGLLTVVGASGAGKSTVANALLGLWPYQAGEIRIGDRELRTLDPEALRGMIGVVMQRSYLFNASIRTNLLLARPGATDAEIGAAAERAQLHRFIRTLPAGYDTVIGENGVQLSGGERQRLAIARALLKDAPILVLDEPTAALDRTTAAEVWQALEPLMQGRTTLLITHLLDHSPERGQVAVMDRGAVIELGSHHALLAANGPYRRLWDQQQHRLE